MNLHVASHTDSPRTSPPSPLGRDEVYEPRGARRGAALAWCSRPWGLQVTTSMSYWLRNIPTEVGEPTASTGGQRGDEQSSQSTAKAGSAAPRRSIAAIRSYIISSGHFLVAALAAALATSGRRRGHAHGTVRPASPVQRPGRRTAAETRAQVHREQLSQLAPRRVCDGRRSAAMDPADAADAGHHRQEAQAHRQPAEEAAVPLPPRREAQRRTSDVPQPSEEAAR